MGLLDKLIDKIVDSAKKKKVDSTVQTQTPHFRSLFIGFYAIPP